MVKRNWGLFSLIIILATVLDQVTKTLVLSNIDLHGSVPVISGFFNIVHTRNRGMAFGLFNNPDQGPAFYFLTGANRRSSSSDFFLIELFRPDDER